MISFVTVTVSILLAAREKQYISSNWLFGWLDFNDAFNTISVIRL